jgi:glycyl-tRNA synthetase
MKKEIKNELMEKIVNLCKRRGIIFPSSEIYGGTGSVWDYGPYGAVIKKNVKDLWIRDMVQLRDDMVMQDSSILMNPKVWEASGHISSFTDPLVECKSCHHRFREDHILEGRYGNVVGKDGKAICPDCGGTLTESKMFNLMFKTFMGPVEDSAHTAFLRPETAQGIFVNFKLVLETSRKKIPFGIAQIGKSFRNEITPGNFTFRTREFEQMEIEYFVRPEDADKWYEKWIKIREKWYRDYGIKKDNLRLRKHSKKELAHYAKGATDIEYKFPFGWSELEGIANRADYDLKQHEKFSGHDMTYFEEEGMKKYYPYVIEPSGGVDRAILALIVDAYDENDKGEVFLRLDPRISPVKIAVFPLVNKEKLPIIAKQIYDELKQFWFVQYDDSGSVGRRYRRQDEIGTPYCVTVDFDSPKKNTVTVRDRDSMKQERVKIKDLTQYLKEKLDII